MELGAEFEDVAPMLSDRKREFREIECQIAAAHATKDRDGVRAAIARKVEKLASGVSRGSLHGSAHDP